MQLEEHTRDELVTIAEAESKRDSRLIRGKKKMKKQPEENICENCKYYWERKRTADIQLQALDGSALDGSATGNVLIQIDRLCLRLMPLQVHDLCDIEVSRCNEYVLRILQGERDVSKGIRTMERGKKHT